MGPYKGPFFIGGSMTFTVYSKPGCGFCTKIERVLQLSEQKYVVYKLGKDFSPKEFVDEFGDDATFPQITYGDKVLGGCNETIDFLKEKNYL